MDNNRNLQQKDSRAILPAVAKITCTEGLNATDCGNLTFSIAKLALWYNGTKTPSDSLLEMDFEYEYDDDTWPLERIISAIVPIFFGIIGFAGLLGNALVILGKYCKIIAHAECANECACENLFSYKCEVT
uniref:G-protein coupled receptors family 1 profile domain-containing protein n=1 Tax=Glossina palpalis gambiensis TaxID=67801 RepID=A0A1B0BQ99_9MUSC